MVQVNLTVTDEIPINKEQARTVRETIVHGNLPGSESPGLFRTRLAKQKCIAITKKNYRIITDECSFCNNGSDVNTDSLHDGWL